MRQKDSFILRISLSQAVTMDENCVEKSMYRLLLKLQFIIPFPWKIPTISRRIQTSKTLYSSMCVAGMKFSRTYHDSDFIHTHWHIESDAFICQSVLLLLEPHKCHRTHTCTKANARISRRTSFAIIAWWTQLLVPSIDRTRSKQ